MFGARRSLFMLMLCTLYVLNLSVSVKKNIFVGLTRTAGMNKQLSSELLKCNQQTGAYKFNCMELPCISYQDNIGNLKQLCNNINKYDYIIVTSPKAAKILMDVRSHLNSSGVKYISIGSGTSIILKNHNIIPVFELNGADVSATALGRELPLEVCLCF